MTDEDILDNTFHGCALTAWLLQAAEQQGWPDSEGTRERAYRLYEQALAEKICRSGQAPSVARRRVPEDVTP